MSANVFQRNNVGCKGLPSTPGLITIRFKFESVFVTLGSKCRTFIGALTRGPLLGGSCRVNQYLSGWILMLERFRGSPKVSAGGHGPTD